MHRNKWWCCASHLLTGKWGWEGRFLVTPRPGHMCQATFLGNIYWEASHSNSGEHKEAQWRIQSWRASQDVCSLLLGWWFAITGLLIKDSYTVCELLSLIFGWWYFTFEDIIQWMQFITTKVESSLENHIKGRILLPNSNIIYYGGRKKACVFQSKISWLYFRGQYIWF